MRIACVVIAGGKRTELIRSSVLPSILARGFSDIVVVGEFEVGDGYRYLHVPDLLKTTTDALIKRDVGTLAVDADAILYLSDDHALLDLSLGALDAITDSRTWHVLVPERFTEHPEQGVIQIPMGESEGYCAGHAGLFARSLIMACPWTTMPHHPQWDVFASQRQQDLGAKFLSVPWFRVLDLEPERQPWR